MMRIVDFVVESPVKRHLPQQLKHETRNTKHSRICDVAQKYTKPANMGDFLSNVNLIHKLFRH